MVLSAVHVVFVVGEWSVRVLSVVVVVLRGVDFERLLLGIWSNSDVLGFGAISYEFACSLDFEAVRMVVHVEVPKFALSGYVYIKDFLHCLGGPQWSWPPYPACGRGGFVKCLVIECGFVRRAGIIV